MTDRRILYVAAFLRALATGMLGVLIGIYLATLGLPAGRIGVIVGLGLAGGAAATAAAMFLGDRVGRKRFLIALALLGILGTIGFLALADPWAIAAAAFIGMLNGMGRDRGAALALAAAVQRQSDHPLAKAVVQAAEARAQGNAVPAAAHARAVPGRGVEAEVNGRRLAIGSGRWLDELALAVPPALAARARSLEAAGNTVSWLFALNGETQGEAVLALLAFGDTVKPTAREAIASLKAMGIRSVLVTGDNAGSAAAVAAQLGIDEVHAQVLPDDKARTIRDLKIKSGGIVAMAGDGINDAPALAAADIGIAMATGTDVAMHAAGITLMRGDPALVAAAIDISRRTWRKIQQNLFWAFIYNLIGIPLAAFGLLNPMLAGAAMAFSSVSVVTNALLLRTWRGQR